jgi:hypothetical protein
VSYIYVFVETSLEFLEEGQGLSDKLGVSKVWVSQLFLDAILQTHFSIGQYCSFQVEIGLDERQLTKDHNIDLFLSSENIRAESAQDNTIKVRLYRDLSSYF